MPLEIVSVSPERVRVRISTFQPSEAREWNVRRKSFGSLGSITATADNGERCTIGMFRTRDGEHMQPDYARLRKLLSA